jgi:hypothetical protein
MTNQFNKNQTNINIDEIIDVAINNAEARRNLSNEEMDRINGGASKVVPTTGIIKSELIVMGKIATDNGTKTA